MASTTFGKQLGVDSTVATPGGARGGGEHFLHGSSSQKALANDFVDERAAAVRERIRQDGKQEGLSEAAKRCLTAHHNKGFLQVFEGQPCTLERNKQPDSMDTIENVEEARRLRAAMAQALDHVKRGKETVQFGYLCANSADERFIKAVNAVTDLVISTAATKEKEGALTEEEAKLVNEAAIMKDLKIEDFRRPEVAERVKEFTVVKHMVLMVNRVSELGRTTLMAVLNSAVHRRYVTLAEGYISTNGDVESMYQITSPVGCILDNLEKVGRASSHAGLEIVRNRLTQARVPWASLDKKCGVQHWIEGVFMDWLEAFQEEYRKITDKPGYGSVPGEEPLWALLRSIEMGGSHQNSGNYSKASGALQQIISDTENLIYDARGDLMSDDQRFNILVQKLYKLDEGANWKAELKSTGQGHSKPGGGRGTILNVQEGKERKTTAPTTTKTIRNICFSNLHTGMCSKGKSCGFVHLTSAERKEYPMCTDKRCTRRNGCKFRHADDEVNLAAEEPESGVSGSKAKTGGGPNKHGKEEPAIRFIQVVDEFAEEENEGVETN